MHRDDSCSSGIAVISFFTGAIAGATAALLLAPRSGRETRERLAEYSEEFREKVGYLPEDIKERGAEMADRGRKMIDRGREMIEHGTSLIDEGKQFLDDKKQALNAAIEAGREAMQREREALSASMGDDNE